MALKRIIGVSCFFRAQEFCVRPLSDGTRRRPERSQISRKEYFSTINTKTTLFRGREIQYDHFQPVISDQKSSKRSSIDGTKMVWMRLMDKTNMRRKQSKSPTSSDGLPKIKNGILFGAKHKRRILRKRDSTAITEASSLGSRGWSVDTDNALWRVGKSYVLLLTFC